MAHREKPRGETGFWNQADPSPYMLGVPKSHSKFGSWLVFTVVAGTALALLLFAIEIFIF
jgi:hypothetical protein